MQLTTLILGFILSLFSLTAMSHGEGHSNTPVNQETAKTNAAEIVAALVKRDKLEKSWAAVTASFVEKKSSNGNTEWLVIFDNDNIANTSEQKLYVFLTLGGDYIAANFTGK